MIDRKISELTELESPDVNDLLAIVDVSVEDFETKRITITNLATAIPFSTFGEIYASDVMDEITISGSGIANKVQVTSFDTNGLSDNMTPDHANDHVTVDVAGIYLCMCSIHVSSIGAGGGYLVGFSAYKNNGVTEFPNVHGHRSLAGGGGDMGSVSLSGIINLEINDTIELWVWNDTDTKNIVIDDVTLSLRMLGRA